MRVRFAETGFCPKEESEPDGDDDGDDGDAHGAGEIEVSDDRVEGEPLEEEFPAGDSGVGFAGADQALVEMFAVGEIPFFATENAPRESESSIENVIRVEEGGWDEEPRIGFMREDDAESSSDEPERDAADIAHENFGAREVVREETERGARDDESGDGDGLEFGGIGEVRERGDADAGDESLHGGNAVNAVHEIEGV